MPGHEIVPTPYYDNGPAPQGNRGFPSRFLKEFTDLAERPPGNDPYMQAFYAAAIDLAQTNSSFIQLVRGVTQRRESLDPKHFANLFCRGVQYLQINGRQSAGYPHGFETKTKWKNELEDIFDNNLEGLEQILLTKSTTTTVYQRYAGAATIMAALFPHTNALNVADFGCGGNYGLRGLDLQIPFGEFKDHTEDQRVSTLLTQLPQLDNSIAIDLEIPDDPEIKKWRRACLYPQELVHASQIDMFEETLKKSENVRFLQADLCDLPIGNDSNMVAGQSHDIVIISTLCYQMPEQQQTVLETAKEILKPDGIIIIQDFARKTGSNTRSLDFNVNWFGEPYSYRNFVLGARTDWEMKEVLRWESGRCKSVIPGEDFTLLQAPPPPVA